MLNESEGWGLHVPEEWKLKRWMNWVVLDGQFYEEDMGVAEHDIGTGI